MISLSNQFNPPIFECRKCYFSSEFEHFDTRHSFHPLPSYWQTVSGFDSAAVFETSWNLQFLMKTFSSEKKGNLWNHMKEFLIPEMNILTVHRHWEGVCSGLTIVSTFNQQLSRILFANSHTFWPICILFGQFAISRILFCGHWPKWNSWHLESRFFNISWNSWRQISIKLSFNFLFSSLRCQQFIWC